MEKSNFKLENTLNNAQEIDPYKIINNWSEGSLCRALSGKFDSLSSKISKLQAQGRDIKGLDFGSCDFNSINLLGEREKWDMLVIKDCKGNINLTNVDIDHILIKRLHSTNLGFELVESNSRFLGG